MLRTYDVALDMVEAAAWVAEDIEKRDPDLARQMRKALSSVVLNIAEGYGNVGGHKRQRYQTGLGSAREVKACIDTACRMRYVRAVDPTLLDRLDHVTAALVKLSRRRG